MILNLSLRLISVIIYNSNNVLSLRIQSHNYYQMDKNSNEFVKVTAEIDKNKLKIKMPSETRISNLAEYLKRQAKLSPT
jgi:hypothetical protein